MEVGKSDDKIKMANKKETTVNHGLEKLDHDRSIRFALEDHGHEIDEKGHCPSIFTERKIEFSKSVTPTNLVAVFNNDEHSSAVFPFPGTQSVRFTDC